MSSISQFSVRMYYLLPLYFNNVTFTPH